MTSIHDLDLTKEKSITDIAFEYMSVKLEDEEVTPALTQGEKFKKYQKKLNKLEKKVDPLTFNEGFQGLPDNLELSSHGLTNQSNNIIQQNDYSSQQSNIDTLRQQYETTLTEYENLLAQISGISVSYLNRVSGNNPYLGKNIKFTDGTIAYVTKQGVVKPYPSRQIFQETVGKNGCPSQNVIQLSIPYLSSYTKGSTIPTKPQLVVGTPMKSGQSCGNEGANVFVDKLINNPTVSYQGCYADNSTTPLMSFLGGSSPTINLIQNGTFAQPQLANNSWAFYGTQNPWGQLFNNASSVPGWYFNAILLRNSVDWGYPRPYPNGNQCVSIQKTGYISQIVTLQTGISYTLTLSACGRNCCDGSGLSNPINIQLYTTNNTFISTIYNFQAPISKWTTYSTTFTVPTSQNYKLVFSGTWTSSDRATAIQNIQVFTGTSTSGSYTYSQCKDAAIDGGYQYFALQGVNSSTSTGYCSVSNSKPTATSLGQGFVPTKQEAIWASKTVTSQGVTATLTTTGSLEVFNASGQSVFTTPNKSSPPSNYIGCYGDRPSRAMALYNGGSQQYNLQQCQAIAQQNGSPYFGLQNSRSGNNAQCALSNDLTQSLKYGKASNCTKITDGSWSGGGWSNAVYNTNTPDSNYFLILQDDGNLCIYRGRGPSDNQGYIWCSMTNGKQKDANPAYAAANGKYGQNWIPQGSTLAAGDFVGSTNGSIALIMQSDGNLVLYTFTKVLNCQKMADGNTGGGVGTNALYNIAQVAVPSNIGKVAYIDQNAELHPYPTTNIKYGNSYTKFSSTDSPGNDIPGSAYGNTTISSCEDTCNENSNCAGFVFSNNVCYPKTSSMYPSGQKQANTAFDLYVRNKKPNILPIGVPRTVNNVDTISYQNYVNGGEIGDVYGLANATSVQKQQLSQLQSRLNMLSSQITELNSKFGQGTTEAQMQTKDNVKGIQQYLDSIQGIDNRIHHFDTNYENILKDSDIVVLQKNYDYLFWTILACGTLLVSMNIISK